MPPAEGSKRVFHPNRNCARDRLRRRVDDVGHQFTTRNHCNNPTLRLNPSRNPGWVTWLLLSDPPDIMEAIHTLAETLQISNGEAIELIMREEANLPDYGP